MRSTSSFIRLAAHGLLLAFAAFVLVTVGCTGANASTGAQTAPGARAASASSQPLTVATPTAGQQALPVATDQQATVQEPPGLATSGLETSGQVLTACVPGRDKARVESNAVAPTVAHLQDSPGNCSSGLPDRARADTAAAQLSDRIPAALTHLDLGIVRT